MGQREQNEGDAMTTDHQAAVANQRRYSRLTLAQKLAYWFSRAMWALAK
jgi:hypothetical protein